MDNNKINKMIEEYVGYVYGCDGYMLPEDDEFFDDMLARHHSGSEDARAVVRRIEELGLGQFRNNDLSLSTLGILMYEQCGNSVDRFIRRDQKRVDAETRLPARQLKSINGSVVRSWIAIVISLGALAVSIIALILKGG
jgi:hypothetical protein